MRLKLRAEPESVSAARVYLSERLGGRLPRGLLADVVLVVSELVTNSVLHGGLSAGNEVRLSVEVRDGSVWGEVCDPGRGFRPPEEPRPRPDLTGGWGLQIVDRLSSRWGLLGGAQENCVWFEIR